MERAEENEETAEPSGEAIRSRLSNRADPFLVVCRCFSIVTSLVAILCVVVNVLAAIRSFRDSHDIFDGIFRCYAVLIACLVVLAETEWGFILKFSKVLEYWAGRGMLQIFVAVMTRAFPDYMTQKKALLLLQNIASYMLLACGLIYFISARKPSSHSNWGPPTQWSGSFAVELIIREKEKLPVGLDTAKPNIHSQPNQHRPTSSTSVPTDTNCKSRVLQQDKNIMGKTETGTVLALKNRFAALDLDESTG